MTRSQSHVCFDIVYSCHFYCVTILVCDNGKDIQKMGQSSSCDTQLTDWTKCFFYQEDTAEVLRGPLESKQSDPGVCYTTIADLLLSFSEIGCLPLSVNLSWLNEGNGIAALLN